MRTRLSRFMLAGFLFAAASVCAADETKIRVLIVDGQNNHAWKATTPVLKKALEACGRYTVDVATSPLRMQPPKAPKEKTPVALANFKKLQDQYQAYLAELARFEPDLGKYDVLLSNYNGDMWSPKLQADLEGRLKSAKIGMVIVHAANNSFEKWTEYNRMIGMGWRNAKFGERLKLNEKGEQVRVPAGKDGGSNHAYTGPFNIVIRDAEHPITKGMPLEWAHSRDELYDNMRGPIENVRLLATAYSYKDKKGTGQHEPMIWTVSYGKGRVFHTPMGHDANAMMCVGFQTTLQRGTEWAATGNVTIPIPANFPTDKKVSVVPN